MKKIVSLLLCVAVIATMFTVFEVDARAASADDKLWTDYAQEIIPNQDGIYEISTPEQLAWVAFKTNSEANWSVQKKFVLTKDIDLGLHQWVPIGRLNGEISNDEYSFTGYFDGRNHTISNLTITGNVKNEEHTTVGLFGALNSVTVRDDTNPEGVVAVNSVKNFNLKDIEIDVAVDQNKEVYVGAVAGYSFGNIINTSVTGSITTQDISRVGGIVGLNEYPITNAMSNVTINTSNKRLFVGGIVGENRKATITNCASYGAIIITDEIFSYVGGLVGLTMECIQNSFSTSTITMRNINPDQVVGKLVGNVKNDKRLNGQVISCYAASDINKGMKLIGQTDVSGSDVISVEEKTMAEMKSKNFSDLLNSLATSATLGESKQISKEISDIFPQVLSRWKNEDGQFPQISMKVGELTAGSSIDSSQISANATIPTPTYTITIPTTIDFGEQTQALDKYKDEEVDQSGTEVNVSQPIILSATGISNLFNDLNDGKGDHINISVSHTGKLVGKKSAQNEVPFILTQGDQEVVTGANIATFYNDVDLGHDGKPKENIATAEIMMNRTNITKADTYSGILTFTVAVAER